ncbi:MAG: hypothetical protein QOJ12_131 [Thermoleophilales bacterium]|jgi:uncharacterized membrane protein (DUF485 family)|nr:hypothetical protein [Thermoleophilales bacterium]
MTEFSERRFARGNGSSDPARLGNEPDWDGIAESPEFQALLASRRRFLVPSVAFFCAYFVAFLALLAWAPDAMAKHVLGSVSVALLLGASVVFLTFVMAWLYTRKSAQWSDLSRRVTAAATPPPAPVERSAR